MVSTVVRRRFSDEGIRTNTFTCSAFPPGPNFRITTKQARLLTTGEEGDRRIHIATMQSRSGRQGVDPPSSSSAAAGNSSVVHHFRQNFELSGFGSPGEALVVSFKENMTFPCTLSDFGSPCLSRLLPLSLSPSLRMLCYSSWRYRVCRR